MSSKKRKETNFESHQETSKSVSLEAQVLGPNGSRVPASSTTFHPSTHPLPGSSSTLPVVAQTGTGGGGGGGGGSSSHVASAVLNTLKYKQPGSVFVVGSGDCAQLGLGPDIFEKERPARISFFSDGTLTTSSALNGDADDDVSCPPPIHIVKVAAGGLHTLALSLDGKLYSWGCNDQKALGRSGEESEPGLVEGLENVNIVDMECGDSCSIALSDTGHVYGWGTFRGTNGIFGFAPGIETQPTPLHLPDLKNISQISCGTNHALALSSKEGGKIYSWGIGEQDQLGRKIMTRVNVLGASLIPRPINFRPKKRKNAKFGMAKCGGYHSVLVHSSNGMYAFGLNNYGQLGVGMTDSHDSALPSLMQGISEENEIVDICGGEHFTVVLDSLGQVWVSGRNDSGQLGLDSESVPEFTPILTKIPTLPPIKSISCGAAFSLAVTRDGDLWAWGYGEMGQLANESSDAPVPFQVDLKGRKVIMASGGGQHSVFLVTPK